MFKKFNTAMKNTRILVNKVKNILLWTLHSLTSEKEKTKQVGICAPASPGTPPAGGSGSYTAGTLCATFCLNFLENFQKEHCSKGTLDKYTNIGI
jgi:hypothetical protein